MEKYYQFAGVEVLISIKDQWMYEDERHLAPFRVKSVENPHRFTFEMVDRLFPPFEEKLVAYPDYCVYGRKDERVRYIGLVEAGWEQAYMRAAHHGKNHYVQLKRNRYTCRFGVKTVLSSLEMEHLVLQGGGFILHASYIRWNGMAVLFTAPSGTGKSTQADLWHSIRGAQIINGDRVAVRIAAGKAFAAGTPFAGSSQYCENLTLPLAAIIYLKQAPQTTIRRLHGAEAFRRVWEGCSVNIWDREDVMLVSDMVQKVLMAVPTFELACTPDESAIIALEGVLMR